MSEFRHSRFLDSSGEGSSVFVGEAETIAHNDVRYLGNDWNEYKVIKYLKREKRWSKTYRTVWKKAKEYLRRNDRITDTDDYISCLKVALCCYTIDVPDFYRKFNKECRKLTKQNWGRFKYKSMWVMLRDACRSFHIDSDPKQNKTYNTLYRGLNFHFPNNIMPAIGDMVYSKQYMSTSISQEVTEFFQKSKNSDKRTIILIKGKTETGKGIKKFSMNPNEEEVLITPFEYFQVIRIDTNDLIHKIILKSD